MLIGPAVLFVLVCFVYPVGSFIIKAFTFPGWGLQNVTWLLSDSTAIDVLVRTLVVACGVTLITLVLGYPYAYLMSVAGPRARVVLTLLVLLPFWTSLMVRTFAWVVILQDNGVLNAGLNGLGLPSAHLLRTTPGVLIGMCQVLMPFMVLPLYATMRTIDRKLIQAGQILGASPRQAFWRVFVPLSLPGILAGTLTVFIMSLGFYVTPAVLGSPKQELLPNALYTQISELLQWGHGAALAVALLLTAGAVLGLAMAVSKKFGSRISDAGRLEL
ncbi:ABC transporter permease [Aeromicrobium sp.]|uniref:ABC transporter permease n=1 Tax=Aeromicrobium sp. TaxID=1871063 RepID=UPI0019A9CE03|nr:ABC transporter permease [Aeromicrobium sp.]MBC7630801.1 ABC transporter permease [Aeromicrobium sp.]